VAEKSDDDAGLTVEHGSKLRFQPNQSPEIPCCNLSAIEPPINESQQRGAEFNSAK